MMHSSVDTGENLVFLISQPRAGSTLTQKILGNHSEIHTASEPWMMLYPLYALRRNGYKAEYDADCYRDGLESFLSTLGDDGRALYFRHVSQAYGSLYQRAIELSGKSLFLDKTPRYYNIIPELHETFPEAKMIFLLRNPLAVLCSIVDAWIQDRWLALRNFKRDILDAPTLLLGGINTFGSNAVTLHYEKILLNSDDEIRRACDYLKVDFSPNLTNYGGGISKKWRMGDYKNVYKKNFPDAQNAMKWVDSLEDPQMWRLVSDYLDMLGEETFQSLGYDYVEFRSLINSLHPGGLSLWNTLPLSWLLKDYDEFKSLDYGYYPVRLLNALQRRGFSGAGAEAGRKLKRQIKRFPSIYSSQGREKVETLNQSN